MEWLPTFPWNHCPGSRGIRTLERGNRTFPEGLGQTLQLPTAGLAKTTMHFFLYLISNGTDQQFFADPWGWCNPKQLGPSLAQCVRAKAAEFLELGGQQTVWLAHGLTDRLVGDPIQPDIAGLFGNDVQPLLLAKRPRNSPAYRMSLPGSRLRQVTDAGALGPPYHGDDLIDLAWLAVAASFWRRGSCWFLR